MRRVRLETSSRGWSGLRAWARAFHHPYTGLRSTSSLDGAGTTRNQLAWAKSHGIRRFFRDRVRACIANVAHVQAKGRRTRRMAVHQRWFVHQFALQLGNELLFIPVSEPRREPRRGRVSSTRRMDAEAGVLWRFLRDGYQVIDWQLRYVRVTSSPTPVSSAVFAHQTSSRGIDHIVDGFEFLRHVWIE